MEWPSGKIRQLTHEKDPKADSSEDAWSPDGKSIFATRTVGLVDSDIFRVDVATGKAEKILEHPEKQMFSVTDVSRDGRTLLVTSNAIGGYFNAALLDPKTKRLSWLTHTQWSVSGGAFTPDGTSLLIHQNSSHPQELYALAKDDKFTQITHSANETLQKAALPKSQLVTYKSFDGSVISAFVWVPFNLKRDGTAASGGSCPTVARPSRRRMPSTDVQSYLHREVLW
jgi:dipeptidyl aminopeptidase/acylaminoacyl peptidase